MSKQVKEGLNFHWSFLHIYYNIRYSNPTFSPSQYIFYFLHKILNKFPRAPLHRLCTRMQQQQIFHPG